MLFRKFLLSFLCLAGISHAATRFVSTSGDDSDNGSWDKPWKTLNRAVQTVKAGDLIYVREGRYTLNNPVLLNRRGQANRWIVISGYPGEKAILDAARLDTDDEAALVLRNAAYIRVQNLRIQNSPTKGIAVQRSHHIDLFYNRISSTWGSGIAAWGDSGDKIWCDYIRIIGNHVYKPNSKDMFRGSGEQRKPPHEGVTLARVSNFEVAWNEVSYGDKEGIDCKGPCRHGKIHHNHVHHHDNHPFSVGIYIDAWTEALYDIEIFRNTVHDCGDGIHINSEDGVDVENIDVHHNVLYNFHWTGIAVHNWAEKDGKKGWTRDVRIWNNTVFNANAGLWIGGPTVSDVTVINNIFADSRHKDVENARGINFVDNNVNLRNTLYNGRVDAKGSNAVKANPQFKDSDGADFTLMNSSPAIDAGNSDASYTDADGTVADIGALFFDQSTRQPASANETYPADQTWQLDPFTVLKWGAAAGAVSYKLTLAYDASFNNVLTVHSTEDTLWYPGLLPPGETLFWRVDAMNAAGITTGEAKELKIRKLEPEKGNDNSAHSKLYPVYPNPGAGQQHAVFDLYRNGTIRAEILSTDGRCVAVLADRFFHAGRHTLQWDGSGRAAGFYLLHLSTAEDSHTVKFVAMD